MWKLLAVCLSTSFRLHCGCLGGVTLQWHSTSASGLILTVTRQFITPGSTQEACTNTQTRRALTWNDRCKAVLILYLTDKMSRWNTRCAFVYWWLLRGAGHLHGNAAAPTFNTTFQKKNSCYITTAKMINASPTESTGKSHRGTESSFRQKTFNQSLWATTRKYAVTFSTAESSCVLLCTSHLSTTTSTSLSASDILNMYLNSQVSCWGAAPGSVWHLLLAVLWSRKKVSGHQPEWADKRQTRSMTNKAKRRKKLAANPILFACCLFYISLSAQ